MHYPKITVIVPVYNMEKTLNRTLDSLLAQTYKDYEVVMVDDGASDGSGRICDEYAATYANFRTIHKPNGGLSSARNKGMDNANGEWITFCDADDYALPYWLNIFAEHCIGNDLVVQGFVTDKTDIPTGVDYTGNAHGAFKMLAQHSIIGYTWMKLFRRDIIRQYDFRFREDSIFREDEEFLLRYLNVIERVVCTKNGAYVYNMTDLGRKYSAADNFYCSCSMFRSIQELMGNSFNQYSKAYLDELNNALFYSFTVKKSDRCKRLEAYQRVVGWNVVYSRLNIFSKLVLLIIRYPKIASWVFDIKAQLKK